MTIDPFLSYAQSKQGSIIARNQSDALARLQAGDLLFYYYPNGVNVSNPINHVNMYDGNGRVYQESSPGHDASLDSIDWPHFVQANRYFGGNQTSFPGSTTTPASAVADTKAGVPTDTPRLSEGVGVALTSLAWWKLVAIGALGALLLWAGYMSVIGKSVMSSVGSIANATS
jgi:cell wall-associated NlpC family hydrolase